jgi:hypothetical protein
MSFRPALIKPTYDVANFGHDTSLPLNCISGNVATITPSTSTFVQVLEDGRVPIDEVDLFITDSDKMALIHLGDDTDWDKTWEWSPDMSAQAYTLTFDFAVGMKVSSYTSGNFKISDVQVICNQVGGGEGTVNFVNKIIDPGMSNMTSAVAQVAIINFSTTVSTKVFDKPLTFQIKVNTDSGSGTYQTGIIPLFCYFGTAIPKTWTTSSVLMHLHADLAHAFPIFRDEDNMNMLDTGIGI